jgi:hypothetical protein
MLDRYRLSEKGEILKKFFTDNEFWMALVALYVSYFKHKQVTSGNVSFLIDLCIELIDKKKLNDDLMAEVLLYKATEHTKITISEIKNIFGVEITSNVQLSSNLFAERDAFRNHCFNYELKKVHEIKQTSERYELLRDGIFLERYAIDNEEWQILLMLHFANRYYAGIQRDDGTPEITHPTRAACDLIDRNVTDPKKIIKEIGHDLIENTGMNPDYIKRVFHSSDIAVDISRLSKEPIHKENPGVYFAGILESEDASVVKAVDIENVIGDAIISYKIERLKRKVAEVKIYGLQMIKDARNNPEYRRVKGIFFSCRNHIKNMIGSIERYLAVIDIVVFVFKNWKPIQESLEKSRSLLSDLDVEVKNNFRRNVIEHLISQVKATIESSAEYEIGINEQKRKFFELVKFENNPLN